MTRFVHRYLLPAILPNRLRWPILETTATVSILPHVDPVVKLAHDAQHPASGSVVGPEQRPDGPLQSPTRSVLVFTITTTPHSDS